MPFNFNPLSLDFPALCLECLEPPPNVFSSTPHSTSTSWSINPPGDKEKEVLLAYFQEEFRKWKLSCANKMAAVLEEMPRATSQSSSQQEDSARAVQNAQWAAEKLENQVNEHLMSAFLVWSRLPAQRQQELWVLEMARSISSKREEAETLRREQRSLRQENKNLRTQLDQLNQQQQPKEFRLVPPMTLKVDEKLLEFWTDPAARGQRQAGAGFQDHGPDLNSVVNGAIDRWKSIILTARAARGLTTQRPLDDSSSQLQANASTNNPKTPSVQHTTQTQSRHQGRHGTYQQSTHGPDLGVDQNTSARSYGLSVSEPMTSATSTPVQSNMGSNLDEDDDNDDEDEEDDDADADADIEMEGSSEYLSGTNTSAHQPIPQLAQHTGGQATQIHPVARSQEHHMVASRQGQYLPRATTYGNQGLLPSQQVHMSQEAFGHQMQSLEHHLAQGHGGADMSWNPQ